MKLIDVHSQITFCVYIVFQEVRFLGMPPLYVVVFASCGHILFLCSFSVCLSVRGQCHLSWNGGDVQPGHSSAPLPWRDNVDHLSTSALNVWNEIKSVYQIGMDGFLCLQYFFHWDLKIKSLKVIVSPCGVHSITWNRYHVVFLAL